MTNEQERAAFEAWANGRCELHLVNLAGRYSSAITQFAWEGYQAGRAALQSQDREDAERYRRLRKGDIDDVAVVRGLGAMDYGASAVIATYSEEIDGDDLDAAIDHARRIEGGET